MNRLNFLVLGILLWAAAGGIPVVAGILPVPIFRQSTDYSCGAASLISILYYYDVFDGTESELFPILGTDPKVGTAPSGIVTGAIHFGLKAKLKTEVTFEEIAEALKRKEPVIVNYQAWAEKTPTSWVNEWDDGHYGVAVDLDDNWIYLMDPVLGNRYGKIAREEFVTRWHDIDGGNEKLQRAAIFISGKTPAKQFPLPIALVP